MNKQPLVTIVTPSFQQGEYLEETILSVLNQDYPNIEYIIIDGGSKDSSLDIIRKYENRLAYWVSEPDLGQADAVNKGWQHANGEFLGWLNSDDLLCPGAITASVSYLVNHTEVGFIYGDLIHIDSKSNELSRIEVSDLNVETLIRKAAWISQPGNLFRRSIVDKIGKLDISLHFQLDLDYWIRVGLVSNFKHMHKVLAKFRVHELSKTSSKSYLAAQDILVIYNKIFSRQDLPYLIKKNQNESWANAHFYSSRAWMGNFNTEMAIKEAIIAIKLFPRVMFSMAFAKHIMDILLVSVLGESFVTMLKKFLKLLRHK